MKLLPCLILFKIIYWHLRFRPAEYKSWDVPEILRSGNLKAIETWRHEQSLERTKKRRPDLYEKYSK